MPLLTTGAGKFPAIGGGSFTGAGDIVGSAQTWWGLRGYNAAYATGSNPAVDIVDQAGVNDLTVNILSNGNLDVASVSSWVTANSVSTIRVKRLYDQSGNARHLTQATTANMPVLTLNAIGSLPGLTMSGSQEMDTTGYSAPSSGAGGGTWTAVAKRTANSSSLACIITTDGGPILAFKDAADQINFTGYGSLLVSGATENAFHSATLAYNAAGDLLTLYVDSLPPATQASFANPGSGISIGRRVDGAVPLTGVWLEGGIWGSEFTSGQASSMNSNQHTYWGF